MPVFTDKEVQDLKETFKMFDTNNDGAIDVHELRQVMKKMHIHATQMELLDMISSVDEDASGTIDFQEFLVLMQSRVGAGGPDQDLRQAFKHFDKNDTNYIDKQSMKRTMIEFDNPLTDDELNAIFDEADLDDDGRITFREFQDLMRS